MNPAHAMLIAGIATITFIAAIPAGAIDPTPEPGEETCRVEAKAPSRMWTSCTKEGDFRATNITLAGRAAIAGALFAGDARVRTLEATGTVTGGDADFGSLAADTVSAKHVASEALRVSGAAEVASLRLTGTGAGGTCSTGTLAIARNAAGSDVLQACLRSAQGTPHWVAVATG